MKVGSLSGITYLFVIPKNYKWAISIRKNRNCQMYIFNISLCKMIMAGHHNLSERHDFFPLLHLNIFLLYTTPTTIGDLSIFTTKHHFTVIWQSVEPMPWQQITNKYQLRYCQSLPQCHHYQTYLYATWKCLTLLLTDGIHSNYNPLFLGTIFWNSSGDIK